MSADEPRIYDVYMLQVPVALWASTQEATDALLREFTLIAAEQREKPLESHHAVPARLTQLIEDLTSQFEGVSSVQEEQLYAASAAGEGSIDLHFQVPYEVAAASRTLGAMLDEADEYCRAGQHLLTLAATPEQVKFRWWYLDQFIDQIAGKPPVPWPDYTR